jgi:hypothetical protein
MGNKLQGYYIQGDQIVEINDDKLVVSCCLPTLYFHEEIKDHSIRILTKIKGSNDIRIIIYVDDQNVIHGIKSEGRYGKLFASNHYYINK